MKKYPISVLVIALSLLAGCSAQQVASNTIGVVGSAASAAAGTAGAIAGTAAGGPIGGAAGAALGSGIVGIIL